MSRRFPTKQGEVEISKGVNLEVKQGSNFTTTKEVFHAIHPYKNYKYSRCCSVCSLSKSKYQNLTSDSYFKCTLILLQGIFYNYVKAKFKFTFHLGIRDIGHPYDEFLM